MFSHSVRIYWEDTDAGGVVYHAQYLAFLERARSEWMRARGHGQERLRRDYGLLFAVRAMQVDFLKPARLDDALEVTAALQKCRRASVIFRQEIRRGGERLLAATVRVAALGTDFRPTPIPQPLYDEMNALVEKDA